MDKDLKLGYSQVKAIEDFFEMHQNEDLPEFVPGKNSTYSMLMYDIDQAIISTAHLSYLAQFGDDDPDKIYGALFGVKRELKELKESIDEYLQDINHSY